MAKMTAAMAEKINLAHKLGYGIGLCVDDTFPLQRTGLEQGRSTGAPAPAV